MSMGSCPGQDRRFLKAEIIKCGTCGYDVEMFSDEINVKCPGCGKSVSRTKLPSCVDWCKYAKQCVGEKRWNETKMTEGGADYKDRLLSEMRDYFGQDRKRIEHAEKVTSYAERIMEKEGGDRSVIISAAVLHDIGIKECERKYNSSAGNLQEKESPPVARKILEKLGVKEAVIDEVCVMIASHHSPGEVNTLNFRVLWDADQLVNYCDDHDNGDEGKRREIIKELFQTQTGRNIAETEFCGKEG